MTQADKPPGLSAREFKTLLVTAFSLSLPAMTTGSLLLSVCPAAVVVGAVAARAARVRAVTRRGGEYLT